MTAPTVLEPEVASTPIEKPSAKAPPPKTVIEQRATAPLVDRHDNLTAVLIRLIRWPSHQVHQVKICTQLDHARTMQLLPKQNP